MLRASALALCTGLWLVLSVISVGLCIPGGATAVLFMTCGVGVVLFVVPTLWLYLTPILPAFVFALWRRRVAAVVALTGMLSVAVVPSVLSKLLARWDVARVTSGDHDAPLPDHPRYLRVVSPGTVRPGRELSDLPCDTTCQRLLYTGEVEAVEVLRLSTIGATATAVWRREPRAACPAAFSEASKALPAVTRATARGDCLVQDVGATLAEAPWVRVDRASYRDLDAARSCEVLHRIRAIHRVSAGLTQTPFDQPTVYETRVTSEVIRWPTAFVPSDGDIMHLAMELWRQPRAVAATGLDDVVRELFGYAVADLPVQPTPDLDVVRQLLKQPGALPFGADHQQLIRDAVGTLARNTASLGADEDELIAALLRDARVLDLYPLGDVLRRRQSVSPDLAEALVARLRLEAVDAGTTHTGDRLARLVFELPAEAFLPHVDALRDVVAADSQGRVEPLIALVTLASGDSAAWVDAALRSEDTGQLLGGLAAACNADGAFAAPRLDAVALFLDPNRGQKEQVLAVRTLRRHGRADLADGFLSTLDKRARTRFEAQLDARAWAGVPDGCRS